MRRLLPLAFVSLLLAGSVAGVCNVPQPRLVCAEYFASKIVVEATLVNIKVVPSKSDPEAFIYTLRADRVIRDNIAKAFRVYEGNDSGRATFDWKLGRRYLLFLNYWSLEKSWTLDGCGNSGPISGAKAVLKEIAAIQRRQGDGFIHGVVSQETPSISMPGVKVEARGRSGVYTATTNASGDFEIKVPPGLYVVQAVRAGYLFGAAEFSYEDPGQLQVEPGGCVQVQLAAHKPSVVVGDKGAMRTDAPTAVFTLRSLGRRLEWRPRSGRRIKS